MQYPYPPATPNSSEAHVFHVKDQSIWQTAATKLYGEGQAPDPVFVSVATDQLKTSIYIILGQIKS